MAARRQRLSRELGADVHILGHVEQPEMIDERRQLVPGTSAAHDAAIADTAGEDPEQLAAEDLLRYIGLDARGN